MESETNECHRMSITLIASSYFVGQRQRGAGLMRNYKCVNRLVTLSYLWLEAKLHIKLVRRLVVRIISAFGLGVASHFNDERDSVRYLVQCSFVMA